MVFVFWVAFLALGVWELFFDKVEFETVNLVFAVWSCGYFLVPTALVFWIDGTICRRLDWIIGSTFCLAILFIPILMSGLWLDSVIRVD